MMKEKLIKSKDRVKEHGEVFTPEWIVKDMMDLIPDLSIEAKFLEPSFGNGNFLVEILKRKLDKCAYPSDITEAVASIYGIEWQEDNKEEAISRMLDAILDHASKKERAIEFRLLLSAGAILSENLQVGDALTGKNHDGEDIYFPDWDTSSLEFVKCKYEGGFIRDEKGYHRI